MTVYFSLHPFREPHQCREIVLKFTTNASLLFIIVLAIVASAQRQDRPGNVPAPASQNHRHRVNTKNDEAQRSFDQGLTLLYALDYSEAAKAFQRAATLDPKMAMAYWGISYSMSSDYYYSVAGDPVREREAYEASQQAVALSASGPDAERGYVLALSKRFATARIPTVRRRPSNSRKQCAVSLKSFPTISMPPPSTPRAS